MDPDTGLSKQNSHKKYVVFVESLDLKKMFDLTEERIRKHEDRSIEERITNNEKNRKTKNEEN